VAAVARGAAPRYLTAREKRLLASSPEAIADEAMRDTRPSVLDDCARKLPARPRQDCETIVQINGAAVADINRTQQQTEADTRRLDEQDARSTLDAGALTASKLAAATSVRAGAAR
jgi:hypothetical protein